MELKPYPLCPKYLVSIDGEVFRTYKTREPRRVAKHKDHRGYSWFDKQENDRSKKVMTHRAVLMAWVRLPEDGEECSHLDGNPRNNHVSNLEWATRKQNHAMKIIHGTQQVGSNCPTSKLDEDTVKQIRTYLVAGHSITYLAGMFNVSISTISAIKHRKTWRHI